jgi:lactoylglutathione lyase
MNPLHEIRQIDYTVIFARDMAAMRRFYETVMEFPLQRTLSDKWIEPPPKGALSLQLAFRVAPDQAAECAAHLEEKGVKLTYPLTDHAFGHRTIFFRDPDGNVIEIYAEI